MYAYTFTAGGCTNTQNVTVTVVPANIDAIDDDYTGTPINGAHGGTTPSVLLNDQLNNTIVDTSMVNLSLVDNGGIAGISFDSTGALVIPSNTFEGTYNVTYRICSRISPANCDQAIAKVKIARGLLLTMTSVCRNDVPYIQYKVVPNFTPSVTNAVTATWLNGDKTVLTAQPVVHGLPLEGEILWPGAVVDAQGNALDWPGWYIQDGVWVAGADGFEGTRPDAYLVISVNPTDTFRVSYPPATPACNSNPINKPPVAVNDIDSTSCSSKIITVLGNDSDPQNGTLTVALLSAASVNNATLVVNTNGTVTYTPAAGFSGIDSFAYKITNQAGLSDTATVTISVIAMPVLGGITGPCAMPKDSAQTFSVAPVPGVTSYQWTLPSGWTGSSTTNSIVVTPGNTGGVISVLPVNSGGCTGLSVTYNVSVIDYAKVTIASSPGIVKGDNNSTSIITIQLFDSDGNPIHCSGGTASLCTSSGVFTSVVDNNDGTYTSTLRSSADSSVICGIVGGVRIQQTVTTVFTGPQGSIKGNGPIFETETPLLTFNFSAGTGPFTIVYKAGDKTTNDTLTNVTDNVPYAVNAISKTTLFRLVSIIGSDSARRDDNFTRDTATIIVVEPKIVVTLTADSPKFLADNLYSTTLRIKVKNIGNIDLNSVQVRADLKDVFPNPVQFILDSVQQSGATTTVPNNSYDGIQDLDLFSWNSTPGRRRAVTDNMAALTTPVFYGSTIYNNNATTGLTATDGELTGNKQAAAPYNMVDHNLDRTVAARMRSAEMAPLQRHSSSGPCRNLM